MIDDGVCSFLNSVVFLCGGRDDWVAFVFVMMQRESLTGFLLVKADARMVCDCTTSP